MDIGTGDGYASQTFDAYARLCNRLCNGNDILIFFFTSYSLVVRGLFVCIFILFVFLFFSLFYFL